MGRNAATDKARLDAKEWRARAVSLRRQGFSIREIAAKCDKSPTVVHEALEEARKAVPVEDVVARRAQQDEEIQRLKRACRKAALNGDKDALDSMTKLLAREAKLLGLDMPAKTDVGTFDVTQLTDEQLDVYISTGDIRIALARQGGAGTPPASAGEDARGAGEEAPEVE